MRNIRGLHFHRHRKTDFLRGGDCGVAASGQLLLSHRDAVLGQNLLRRVFGNITSFAFQQGLRRRTVEHRRLVVFLRFIAPLGVGIPGHDGQRAAAAYRRFVMGNPRRIQRGIGFGRYGVARAPRNEYRLVGFGGDGNDLGCHLLRDFAL